MFTLNEDMSIYATRGDIVFFSVTAEDDGKPYVFKAGDVVRIKIYGKKKAEDVVLQKDFPVTADAEKVEIFLTEDDTKIGEVISKPKDYWYEVELNPLTNPQTIIGYDEDGAKVFKLFPEGDDIPPYEPIKPEDIPIVDDELDLTSTRPIENQAVSRAIASISANLEETQKHADAIGTALSFESARIDNIIRTEGTKVSQSLEYLDYISEDTKNKMDAVINSDGNFATITVNLREANLFVGGTGMEVFILPDECRPIDIGQIHTADGLEFIIDYNNGIGKYTLELYAPADTAPFSAGSVTMQYALDDYEVKDGRVSNRGYAHSTIGSHIRDVNNQLDEQFDNLTIDGYENGDLISDIKAECDMVGGYFFRIPDSNMMESDLWNCYTYNVKAGERYHIKTYTVSAGRAVAFMEMPWDADEIDPAITYYPTEASGGEIVDITITVPEGAVQMLVNERAEKCVASINKVVGKKFTKVDDGYVKSVLNGKTIVCCGDSITEAVNPDGGYFTNYAEIVAERHGMICHKDGVGGSTMAYGKGKSFSISRYLNIPKFDYLTIWFGWNDAAYSELGTISDTGNRTFYGAYKMVLEHIVTNNPTKKVGIIVPYGSEAVNPFAQAVRDVSALYGVPCLDLKDHNGCSLLWGTENAVQLARRSALTYDGTHPNQDGYNYLATMYEQFLLGL